MHILARVRSIVARHPWMYWLAVATLAAIVAIGVVHGMARVDAARRSWGTQHAVWTTTGDVEPGQPIAAELREIPTAVVPAGAVDASPVGALATQHIAAGEIVTTVDVALDGAAGLIPEGWVAFAVPESVAHFSVGDHVDVYTSDRLISNGVVVEVSDSDAMVAISAGAAPAMATALQADAVTIALTP